VVKAEAALASATSERPAKAKPGKNQTPEEISMEEKGGRRGGHAVFLSIASAGCV